FDNAYRWLAPWHEIKAGRVAVFPAQRQFVRGRWAGITVHPLLREGVPLASALNDALLPFRDDLSRLPLYISIDKDVLSAGDSAVNWDSGLLRLPEALTIVETFLAAADGRLVGAAEVRSPRPRRTEFIPFRSILSPRNGKVEFTPFRKRSPDRSTVERSGFACFRRL